MSDKPYGMTRADLTNAIRAWDGWDDPYGPAAHRAIDEPQPSKPTPAFGAPSLGRADLNGDPS